MRPDDFIHSSSFQEILHPTTTALDVAGRASDTFIRFQGCKCPSANQSPDHVCLVCSMSEADLPLSTSFSSTVSPQAPRQARTLGQEVLQTVRLGGPLALGELGWMSTYLVDAWMIGRLPNSPLAISASSLGNTIFYAVVFFAIYLLNGLETLIAQAYGRDEKQECVHLLGQSFWIVAISTPLVMLASLGLVHLSALVRHASRHRCRNRQVCARAGVVRSASDGIHGAAPVPAVHEPRHDDHGCPCLPRHWSMPRRTGCFCSGTSARPRWVLPVQPGRRWWFASSC